MKRTRWYSAMKVDGAMTKAIVTVIDQVGPALFTRGLNIMQGAQYINLANKKLTYRTFLSGWLTRVPLR